MSRAALRPVRTLTVACAALATVAGAPVAASAFTAGPNDGGASAPEASATAVETPAVAPERPRLTRHQIIKRTSVTKGGIANISADAPLAVRRLVHAGNQIATTPYVWGGGHGSWKAAGYDCSGSVSYALHGARKLRVAATSGTLATYGEAGPGKWVTIYANGGHAYMVVAGMRFDTSAHGPNGSRWTTAPRDNAGYVVRHPAGM